MSKNSGNGARLIGQGRKKIFLHGFLFGVPVLTTLLVAGLQWAERLRLEKYLVPDRPETVDQGIIYVTLALTALMLSSFGASGIGQGLVMIQKGKRLSREERFQVSAGNS